jgi:hypothetical protein
LWDYVTSLALLAFRYSSLDMFLHSLIVAIDTF